MKTRVHFVLSCVGKRSVYFSVYMAYKTLTITTAAYNRLKNLKAPGESFSDVILREMPEPWKTCGDVLEGMKKTPIPKMDTDLMDQMLQGRGRRS